MGSPFRQPSPLPDHARLLALPSVWMEGNAIEQLARAANMPGCVRAVGMPDLHAGPGMPIGAALAFVDAVHPHLVGSDAGCGARVLAFGKLKARGDALVRRARATFAEPVFATLLDGVDPSRLLERVWRAGARAIAEITTDEELARFAAIQPEPSWLPPSADLPDFIAEGAFGRALGTIGGGNHFVELAAIDRLDDRAFADALGLERRGHVLLAHSGSRGVGKALADHWGLDALDDHQSRAAYLGQLAGAVRFAIANRLLLTWRLAQACGVARISRLGGGFDLVHNFVAREDHRWLHRKGCAPAGRDEPGVVLGSRGAPSWIVRGLGNSDCLCSIAHGAGRRMTRSEARAKVALRHKRASLTQTATGGRVICDDKDLLYEEHPDAYKAIEPVVETLEAASAARRVAALRPMLTIKIR